MALRKDILRQNIISLTAGQPERLVYEEDGLTQRCGMLPPMIDEHNICAVRCTRLVNVILHTETMSLLSRLMFSVSQPMQAH